MESRVSTHLLILGVTALSIVAMTGARVDAASRRGARELRTRTAERSMQTRAGTFPRPPRADTNASAADSEVLRGRYLVLSHACSGCHGGRGDPGAPGWMAGGDSFFINGGPRACFSRRMHAPSPAGRPAAPCYITRARNLTPDDETGLGRFTERQIFNALRYGLRPEDTPDVTITSRKPGEGNFPDHPHYLAPPMPWPDWRFMNDSDLWAVAAYLKHGLKPVHHRVPESQGPPDFWARAYEGAIPRLKLAPYPPAPFPTANEQGGRDVSRPSAGRPATKSQPHTFSTSRP